MVPADKALLERAAAAAHLNVSAFVVQAVAAKAEEILAERSSIRRWWEGLGFHPFDPDEPIVTGHRDPPRERPVVRIRRTPIRSEVRLSGLKDVGVIVCPGRSRVVSRDHGLALWVLAVHRAGGALERCPYVLHTNRLRLRRRVELVARVIV